MSDWEADELTQRQVTYAANDALVGVNVAIVMAVEFGDIKGLNETFDSISDLVLNSEFVRILSRPTFMEDLDASLEYDKVKSRSKVDKKSLEYRLENSRNLTKYAGIGKENNANHAANNQPNAQVRQDLNQSVANEITNDFSLSATTASMAKYPEDYLH